MTKYEPIQRWLSGLKEDSTVLTFRELESILGFQLPPSAKMYRAWWGNERIHHRHTYCRAWLDAGFETQRVKLVQQTLEFRKI